MIGDFLRAFLLVGVPVGSFSYLLIWWGLRAEYFERTSKLKVLEDEVKKIARERSSGKNKKGANGHAPIRPKFTPVHNKWLMFGGGFYGVVALLTFGVIEFSEILGFFSEFRTNVGRLADFNFDLIVNVLIDQLMNFFSALAWPWYWIERSRGEEFWIWFLAAYAGYWLGARAALAGQPTLDSKT